MSQAEDNLQNVTRVGILIAVYRLKNLWNSSDTYVSHPLTENVGFLQNFVSFL